MLETPSAIVPDLGLSMRPVCLEDALLVCKWRNSSDARKGFFTDHIVTPDHHAEFLRNRLPHDYTWMFLSGETPVGMGGLTVHPESRSAEAGRLFVPPEYRCIRHTAGIPLALCWFGFDVLKVDHIWCDILTENRAVVNLNRTIGYNGVGVDVPGHTHAKGSVTHMDRSLKEWQGLKHWLREMRIPAV